MEFVLVLLELPAAPVAPCGELPTAVEHSTAVHPLHGGDDLLFPFGACGAEFSVV